MLVEKKQKLKSFSTVGIKTLQIEKIDWLLIATGVVIFLTGFIFIFDKAIVMIGEINSTANKNA